MDSDVEFFTYLIKISRFGFWKVRWTKQGVTPKNWVFRKGIYELILVPTLFYTINLPQNWFLQPIWCEQKLMKALPWLWAEAPKSFPATRLQDLLPHLLSEKIFFSFYFIKLMWNCKTSYWSVAVLEPQPGLQSDLPRQPSVLYNKLPSSLSFNCGALQ